MTPDFHPANQWQRVAQQLKAHREEQKRAWGETDNILLGRFLAGEVSPEERREVEAALERYPDLRRLTDLVREVMTEPVPEEQSAPAQVVPFAATRSARKPWIVPFLLRGGAVLAAACLVLAVSLPLLLPKTGVEEPREERREVALLRQPQPVSTVAEPLEVPLQKSQPRAFVAAPSAAVSPDQERFREWVVRGKEELARRRFERAEQALTKALEVGNADAEVRVLLKEAQDGRRRVVAMKMEEEAYQAAMGQALTAMRQQQFPTAAQAFHLALKVRPNDTPARLGAERANQMLAYQAALKTDPKAPQPAIEDAIKAVNPAAAGLVIQAKKFADRAWSRGKK